MGRCRDPQVGELIAQYEMGQLGDEDRDRFEEHLLDCEFCRRELEEMLSTIAAVRGNRAEILRGLHDEGISFKSLRGKLLARPRPGRIKRRSLGYIGERIKSSVRTYRRLRVLAPAAVVATALLLFTIFPLLHRPDNPYLNVLFFEKVPYRPQTLRGEMATESERLFLEGMSSYLIDDYKGAIDNLQKAVGEAPENGSWWLYLGVCYYLDRQGKRAIEALTRADALTQHSLKVRARWYLGQAHLLRGDVDRAIPLLEWVRDRRREYGAEAESLLTAVRSVIEEERKDSPIR